MFEPLMMQFHTLSKNRHFLQNFNYASGPTTDCKISDSTSLKNTTMYWYLAAFVALPVYCRLTENNFYLISQRQWNTSTRASIMLRYSCSNCDIADGKWVTTRDIHTHTSLCASLRYVFTSLVLPHKMQHPKFSLGTGQTCGVYWHLLY